jgi:diguanylate cyclase (GGDEF) domain/hemerythrin-like metal-binding domain
MDINTAAVIGEKIRGIIEEHEFEQAKKITISVGVSEKNASESIENWIKKSDNALYKAKKDGRNKVEVYYLDILPIKIQWSNVYECKNASINSEHKELIYSLNDLMEIYFNNYNAETFLAVYDEILKQTVSHFSEEEKILEGTEFPYLENHKKIHRAIVEEAIEAKTLLVKKEKKPAEIIQFLIYRVIMGHMILEDVSFFKYL